MSLGDVVPPSISVLLPDTFLSQILCDNLFARVGKSLLVKSTVLSSVDTISFDDRSIAVDATPSEVSGCHEGLLAKSLRVLLEVLDKVKSSVVG